jgi:crotonobetaine/carnitine-CoA ligase
MTSMPATARTLVQVLAERAATCADRAWIVSSHRRATYGDMSVLSDRLARGFSALGIGARDPVLLLLSDAVDFLACWCALSRLGALEVPVNAHLRGSVLAHVINDSCAATMVVGEEFLDRLSEVAGDLTGLRRLVVHGDGVSRPLFGRFQVTGFDGLLAQAAGAPPCEFTPPERDLMAVMYTSGTTGPSKGVMVTHAHAYEYAAGIGEMLKLTPDDVYYGPLPLFHIAGQWAVAYAACIAGATAVIPGTFSRSDFWKDVNQHGATCGFLLGAMAAMLYRQAPGPGDANTLERVHMVPLLPDTPAFEKRFDCRVSTSWASTEANVPIRADLDRPDSRTCGRPVKRLYEVRIENPQGNEIPPGQRGEALVRARDPALLMAGYWNRPEWTAKAWRSEWLRTGDEFTRDEDGNFYFLDRLDDAIRRRGENISSVEVENEIAAHPAVLECAVVPIASADTEQEVLVVVVPREGMSLEPEDLIGFLEPRLANFMVPRYVEVTTALPKTQTGKVQKFRLRERGLTPATWDREAPRP